VSRPRATPVGLHLARVSKSVGRAFNAALVDAGGSLPVWLVLSSLRATTWRSQLELAHALGIEGATLTRHLDGLEAAGLVRRVRDPEDRRAVRVELTEDGAALHARLLEVVIRFNRRLTAGLGETELDQLRLVLDRLERNVRAPAEPA
jgi:MarR family transcriptional regulator for hemolysin